jgi:hypothetical protein
VSRPLYRTSAETVAGGDIGAIETLVFASASSMRSAVKHVPSSTARPTARAIRTPLISPIQRSNRRTKVFGDEIVGSRGIFSSIDGGCSMAGDCRAPLLSALIQRNPGASSKESVD